MQAIPGPGVAMQAIPPPFPPIFPPPPLLWGYFRCGEGLSAYYSGLLLLRDDKDFQSWDSGTQTLCGPCTADIQSLYSEYTGCADWRIPDLGGKS